MTFIDDHTRLNWVYLLMKEFEAEIIFKITYTIVQTQFHFFLKFFDVIMIKNISKQFKAKFFMKKKSFIKAHVMTLWNKMVWPNKKINTYWK